MLKRKLAWLGGALLLGFQVIACAQNYEVGQLWSYKTRPQEKDSTLMVLHIDNTSKLGQVVFVGVKDVRILHPSGKVLSSMSPLPFTKDALDRSVIKLIGKTDKLMNFDFGYQKWKEAQFAGKRPPTYIKPVAEIIGSLENGYIGIPQK
ncbi:MAG TPA: hypothetical protein VGO84_01040 [Burkholderiales bacterium]|jgi:hypothetical protein|nr:hypothetical protein [Burkholderiales bacterium]